MKPVLFLDVDGVLNSESWFRSAEYQERKEKFKETSLRAEDHKNDAHYIAMLKGTHIDPQCLARLNQLLESGDFDIVLSSTWRLAEFTIQALAECGIEKWTERFLGITRRSRCGEVRGDEIHDWVIENDFKGQFVILDDDGDQAPHMDRLVQTNWGYGLTEKDCEKVLALIEKGATV